MRILMTSILTYHSSVIANAHSWFLGGAWVDIMGLVIPFSLLCLNQSAQKSPNNQR